MTGVPDRTRVLVVACKTVASPTLLQAVCERARRGPCRFTLLVPRPCQGLHKLVDPEDQGWIEAARAIAAATPLLEEAAGGPILAIVGSDEPMAAIQDALNLEGFDEIILSTLPRGVSRWLHIDLPSKVRGLGVPVTVVTAPAAPMPPTGHRAARPARA